MLLEVVVLVLTPIFILLLLYLIRTDPDAIQIARQNSCLDAADPIHPVFRSENFIDGKVDQEAVLLALKLASRLLATDTLAPHWWTLFFGRARGQESSVSFTWPSLGRKRTKHYFLDRETPELSTEDRESVSGALKLLADNVTFGIGYRRAPWWSMLHFSATLPVGRMAIYGVQVEYID